MSARVTGRALPAPAGLVLVLATPFLFMHVKYAGGVELSVGSASVSIVVADLAVLAVAATGLAVGLRDGFAPLRAARAVWIAAAALLAVILIATALGKARHDAYPLADHLVSALKFVEYAALAPAVALLAQGRTRLLALGAVASWAAVASSYGLAQFAGLAGGLDGESRALLRQPSFLGYEDFNVLSAAALVIAIAGVATGAADGTRERALAWLGGTAGAVGVVLSGGLSGVLGVGAAMLGALVLARLRGELTPRRALGTVALVSVVLAGTMLMRGNDIQAFFRFLGIEAKHAQTAGQVESYSQRTLLGYIGLRIFAADPLLGAGWQGSREEYAYGPQLAAAHARFPDEPLRAFPSPEHPWGVHNAYVQALADMGIVGGVVFTGFFALAIIAGARAAVRAPPATALVALVPVLWLLALAGLQNGRGIVAGIPLDALLWLAVGLVARTLWEVDRGEA